MERMGVGQQHLCGSDAAAVTKEWCDVAGQYQSALERMCAFIVIQTYSKESDDPASDTPELRCLLTQPCIRSTFDQRSSTSTTLIYFLTTPRNS